MNGIFYVTAMFGPVAIIDILIVLNLRSRALPQPLTVAEVKENQ